MTFAVESYYNFAYGDSNIAEESSAFNKILVTIENVFRALFASFKKLIHKIMGLKKCMLPKQLNSSLKPLNIHFLRLFLDTKNKLGLDNKDIASNDSELKKIQNSDVYIKLTKAKKEDFDEKDYEDVNMKELVKYMNAATDNITAAKNALTKNKRDPDTTDDTIKVYQLMISIATVHLKTMVRVFSFGKIATKTEEVPLDEPIEAETAEELEKKKQMNL